MSPSSVFRLPVQIHLIHRIDAPVDAPQVPVDFVHGESLSQVQFGRAKGRQRLIQFARIEIGEVGMNGVGKVHSFTSSTSGKIVICRDTGATPSRS